VGDVPALTAAGGQGYVAFGLVLALALLLAFPVFLLVWFSAPTVRAEYERWAG